MASSLLAILLGAFLVGFAAPVFNVQSVALRLSVTPRELLGRVTLSSSSSRRAACRSGRSPRAALFAALRPATAFTVIAVASFLATAVLLCSPVRTRRVIP